MLALAAHFSPCAVVRMRICFQRFSSEDNDLYRGQVHEASSGSTVSVAALP